MKLSYEDLHLMFYVCDLRVEQLKVLIADNNMLGVDSSNIQTHIAKLEVITDKLAEELLDMEYEHIKDGN